VLQASVDHSKLFTMMNKFASGACKSVLTFRIELKNQEQEENASNASRLNDQTKQWTHQQKHKQRCNSTDTSLKKKNHIRKVSLLNIDASAATVIQWRMKPMKTSHQTCTHHRRTGKATHRGQQTANNELTQSTLTLDEGTNYGVKQGERREIIIPSLRYRNGCSALAFSSIAMDLQTISFNE